HARPSFEPRDAAIVPPIETGHAKTDDHIPRHDQTFKFEPPAAQRPNVPHQLRYDAGHPAATTQKAGEDSRKLLSQRAGRQNRTYNTVPRNRSGHGVLRRCKVDWFDLARKQAQPANTHPPFCALHHPGFPKNFIADTFYAAWGCLKIEMTNEVFHLKPHD